MANKRLAKLLDAVIREATFTDEYGRRCALCDCYAPYYEGVGIVTRHQPNCPIPRLRKERYEAGRERKQERDVRPFTRYFLRHIQVFDSIIAELRSAIRECEAYIRNYKDKTYDRNRKAQLEYRLSQIKRELYHREHTRKEGVKA